MTSVELSGTPARERVRPAGRHDVPAIVDLRVRFLGERARLEGKPCLAPGVRARSEAQLPFWIGQDERLVLIVPWLPGERAPGERGEQAVAGYAMGQVSTWPPLFRRTRVGEILEVFVDPAARGLGLGRALITVLTESLAARGVEVLRAAVAARDTTSLARFEALGYRPWQHVLLRRQDAG